MGNFMQQTAKVSVDRRELDDSGMGYPVGGRAVVGKNDRTFTLSALPRPHITGSELQLHHRPTFGQMPKGRQGFQGLLECVEPSRDLGFVHDGYIQNAR